MSAELVSRTNKRWQKYDKLLKLPNLISYWKIAKYSLKVKTIKYRIPIKIKV